MKEPQKAPPLSVNSIEENPVRRISYPGGIVSLDPVDLGGETGSLLLQSLGQDSVFPNRPRHSEQVKLQ